MPQWVRFARDEGPGFGTLEHDEIVEYEGDMFTSPRPANRRHALSDVRLLTPVQPTKMVALANNFHELLQKLGLATPAEPLYFLKAPSSFHPHGLPIRRPHGYEGRIVFEGELGLVIGAECRNVSVEQAGNYLFGCTCVNDVTAFDWLNLDPSFTQWTRAKAPDTFGVFGPAVATGLQPQTLRVHTEVNGQQRQDFGIDDMVFTPAELISHVSRHMTLQPGDVIACGTSTGAGSLKPGATVSVRIDGVGTLENTLA